MESLGEAFQEQVPGETGRELSATGSQGGVSWVEGKSSGWAGQGVPGEEGEARPVTDEARPSHRGETRLQRREGRKCWAQEGGWGWAA